jgi:hypothetical protein
VLAQRRHNLVRIEPDGLPRARHLDHHVEGFGPVVDDAEAHAAVVQLRRDGQIGLRGLEKPAGMVVQAHLPAGRDARQGQHHVHCASRHGARRDHYPVFDLGDEGDFPAARAGDLVRQHRAGGRGDAGGRRGGKRRHGVPVGGS